MKTHTAHALARARALWFSAAFAGAIVGTAAADWESFELVPASLQPQACVGSTVELFQPSPTPPPGSNTGVSAVLWSGAPFASASLRASGVIHAWRFLANPGTTWSYSWTLASGSPQSGALFGAAISIGRTYSASGDALNSAYLIVGSPGHRLTPGSAANEGQAIGYAEAFALSNALGAPTFGTSVPLVPPSLAAGDLYGSTVAAATTGPVNGPLHWAFASAPLSDDGSTLDVGTVHAFRRDTATAYTYLAGLRVPDAAAFDRLGRGALAASGHRVYASLDRGDGAVAVFAMNGGTPAHESTIQPPPSGPAVHGFGAALAVDGGFLVVAAPGGYGRSPDAGTVFILDAAPPHALRQVLASPWPDECAGFGASVSLKQNQLVVGTAEGANSLASGSVAVFALDPATGIATLAATLSGGEDAAFGASVAASGAHVAVGAPGGSTALAGQVSVQSMTASRSPDLNHDGIVNGADLGLLLAKFSQALYEGPEDLNNDLVVNGADLAILLGAWGTSG